MAQEHSARRPGHDGVSALAQRWALCGPRREKAATAHLPSDRNQHGDFDWCLLHREETRNAADQQLFRIGSAVLLSTSSTQARFEMAHVVRNCTSSQDGAYRCVSYEEDDQRILGLNLSQDLVDVAGKALGLTSPWLDRLFFHSQSRLIFCSRSSHRKC
ncbi:3-ketoacyl-CoA synthase 5-like isoform X2 [Triticum urartu]|uniref:3-ketoacyl-CoA synthase 5-like isoform X2 n=1 Tax=Triticum urartu TaxID=4572 RepID=UPI0020430304|nr:3-ketoacyl-CoA synthase 5-like isoform X2 [Triticum urartu]